MLGLHRLLHRHSLERRVVGHAPEDRALVGADGRRDAEQRRACRLLVLVDDDRDARRDRVVAHPCVAVVRPLAPRRLRLDPAASSTPRCRRARRRAAPRRAAPRPSSRDGRTGSARRRGSSPSSPPTPIDECSDRTGDPLAQLELVELRRDRTCRRPAPRGTSTRGPSARRRVGRDIAPSTGSLAASGRERRDVGAVAALAVELPAVVGAARQVAVHLALGQVRRRGASSARWTDARLPACGAIDDEPLAEQRGLDRPVEVDGAGDREPLSGAARPGCPPAAPRVPCGHRASFLRLVRSPTTSAPPLTARI